METNGEYQDTWEREKHMEEILLSSLDPVTKVKRIVGLGIEEDEADEIVRRYQIGQLSPVYYERLEFEDIDYDEDLG